MLAEEHYRLRQFSISGEKLSAGNGKLWNISAI
jgi:hypothetical protein